MLKDVERILIDEKELGEITSRLADKINHDYKDSDKPLILLIILKGSLVFASDLMKKINLPLELEFMKVSSYGAGTKTSGEIKIHLDLMRDHLEQYDLLIIEDIVDSGRTLSSASPQPFYTVRPFSATNNIWTKRNIFSAILYIFVGCVKLTQ